MANKFKTNLLVLGNSVISATGNNLYANGVLIGGSGGTGSTTNTTISPATNSFLFSSGITSGVSSQFISFPSGLGSNPNILISLKSQSNDTLIPTQISGVSTGGFWAAFANTIPDNSYVLNVLAASTSISGLFGTIINNIYTGVIVPDPLTLNNINVNQVLAVANSTPTNTVDISGTFNISNNLSDNDIITATGNFNSFVEINLVNTNTGTDASSDIVASNSASSTSGYVNLGINSSGYTGAFVGFANDSYTYSLANDFYIGNAAAGRDLYLFAGGGNPSATKSGMVIKSTNKVGLFNPQPAYQLDVSGSGNFTSGLFVNNTPVVTGFTSTFITGLQTIRALNAANSYFDLLSGNLGPGTWMTFARVQMRTKPASTGVNITAKVSSGIGAFFTSEATALITGVGTSGNVALCMNGIITLTAASTPISLSCSANVNNTQAVPSPTYNAPAGITSGTSTYLNMVKLF